MIHKQIELDTGTSGYMSNKYPQIMQNPCHKIENYMYAPASQVLLDQDPFVFAHNSGTGGISHII